MFTDSLRGLETHAQAVYARRTLGEIEASLSEIADRAWYTVIFFMFRDRQNIQYNTRKLNDAVELYYVSASSLRSIVLSMDIDSAGIRFTASNLADAKRSNSTKHWAQSTRR
jgi:hypothetical protein